MPRRRQPTFQELFVRGDPVDVQQDGQWMRGKVVRISTRLHVKVPGLAYELAFDRADYNRERIKRRRKLSETTVEKLLDEIRDTLDEQLGKIEDPDQLDDTVRDITNYLALHFPHS